MHKATLTFSLFFLAVVGSAQILTKEADTSSQSPSNISTTASQVYPSDIPIPTTPTANDGDPSQTNRTRPIGCYHHNGSHSAFPTDQPLPSSVFPSAADGAGPISKQHFSCKPDSGSIIPTGTANVPAHGTGALPSMNVSRPIHTGAAPTGTNHHDGNFSLPTGSSEPFPNSTDQQDPPAATATTTYVGRRRLVRRH